MKNVLNFLNENNLIIGDNLLDIHPIIVNNKIVDLMILVKRIDNTYVVDFIDYENLKFLKQDGNEIRGFRYEYNIKDHDYDALNMFKEDSLIYQKNLNEKI